MNRREFVKALAALLGLLVKVPDKKEPYHEIDCLTFSGASYRVEDEVLFETAYAELQAEKIEQPPYELTLGNAEGAAGGVLDALRGSGIPMESNTRCVSIDDKFYRVSLTDNGKVIFVDEVAGDDANDGLSPATAVISPELCVLYAVHQEETS